MSSDRDDDALRWEGDDDPTLAPGWKRVGGAAQVADASAAADAEAGADSSGAHADEAAAAAAVSPRRQAGSVELLALGVLAGVYLLYTVGWMLTAVRTEAPGTSIVGDAMYTFGLWLSALAPALWFGLVHVVVASTSRRLLWLVVGAVVLVPLPFVLGVTA